MEPVNYGRASKGSRYHLQNMVNDDTDYFNKTMFASSSSLIASGATTVEWMSPLKSNTSEKPYYEYRDDFLSPLGFDRHEHLLREFWPKNGPQWDGLGLIKANGAKGCILVEAKAHPAETHSDSKAEDADSIAKIKSALSTVQDFMGIAPTDWMTDHYQLANRFAFLYFMNVKARVPTWLVLVNFVDDRTYRPTDLSSWIQTYRKLFESIGLKSDCRLVDRIVTVFPSLSGQK